MRTLAPLLLVACVAPTAALSEKADREKDIVIVADRWVGDDAKKVTTLTGNVVVTQGTMRITADHLTVRQDAQEHKYYVATGSPVTFRQKRDSTDELVQGEAQRAEFDDRTDVLKLFNGARVRTGANQITGEFISYDMQRELAQASGAPPGKTAPPDSRVKVIIVPKKGEEKGAAGKGQGGKAPPAQLKSDPGRS